MKLAPLALALALISLVAGCARAEGVTNGGPLHRPDGQSTTCVPVHGKGPASFGNPVLRNTGKEPLVLDGVTAVHPANATIAAKDAVATPLDFNGQDNLQIGVWSTFPPPLDQYKEID